MIYLLDGCEANAITFVLPSNNKLNVEPITETPEYKLGFNMKYSTKYFQLNAIPKYIKPHRQWTRSFS